MLTPSEVQELRASIEAAQKRHQPDDPFWVTCDDGPLEGIRYRVGSEDYQDPDTIFGFSQPTDRGTVVLAYIQSGVPGRLRFQGFERPGGNASKPPAPGASAKHPASEADSNLADRPNPHL